MSRAKSPEVRSRLMAATASLLAQGQLADLSVEAIARQAGVAKTTLYRHFGGLDALVFAVAVQGAIGSDELPDTGTLSGDLDLVIRHYLAVAESPLSRQIFSWMLMRALQDAAAAEAFREVRHQPTGPTRRALERAIARGELPADLDLTSALHLIQGPLISQRFIDRSPLSHQEISALARRLAHALVAGSG